MKKRIAAAVLSAVVALNILTGCGNQITGHEAKLISGDSSSESTRQTDKTTNDSIVNPYGDNGQYNDSVDTTIDYLKADNMKYYLDRMVVAGDSIAYGWHYYGIIPKERCVAQGGLSTFGFSVWQYDTTGKKLSMKQTLKKVDPVLLYVCLGMNDVNMISQEKFAEQYKELLQNLVKIVPNCLIVVQSITPVATTNQYKQVNNKSVKEYNAKLREVVAGVGKENIIYFNAYSSLLDESGMMDRQYDGGDGLHINTKAYKKILEDLSVRLNMELGKQRIDIYEEQRSNKQSSADK